MIPPHGLGRQVASAMAIVAITTLLLTFLGYYLFFMLATAFLPSLLPPNNATMPGLVDVYVLGPVGVLVLAIALILSIRLTRRIVSPLTAVTRAARRIAEGDLSARAAPEVALSGEAARLVEDFNSMAQRLEEIAADIVVWNASIAHELRTPLTILRGRLCGLIDGVFEPDEPLFRKLLGQVEGLSRLVEDLRVVSLVESGQFSLQLAFVDVDAEIADFVALVEPGLTEVGFAVTHSADPGMAKLDMTRIRQALLALVDNAQRHARPCTLQIMAHTSPNEVEFCVSDQGPGMAPAFVNRAFKQFSRGSLDERPGHGGSGLGLSVVQAIAIAHGGRARYVHDEAGSTFSIIVPRGLQA